MKKAPKISDKIVYFLLGALVASIGYGIGMFQRPLTAADQTTKIDWLHVSEGIIVGENKLVEGNRVMVLPDRIVVSGKNQTTTALIACDRISIKNKEVESMVGIGEDNAVCLLSHHGKNQHVGIQLKPAAQLVVNDAGKVRRIP